MEAKKIDGAEVDAAWFWSRVNRGEPDGCWTWRFKPNLPKGYAGLNYRGRNYRAHRVAYAIANGEAPEGLLVCHRCDNPPCCNPAHLFAGTTLDNALDMIAKGRKASRKGTKNGRAKLTPQQVIEVQKMYADGKHTQKQIAAKFGMSKSMIGYIVRRQYWQDVHENITA